jgi:2-hydroxy-3-oxopropionate reductase
MRVAVIGLGRMGRPMAARLLAAGHEVVVHNRSRGPVEALARQGARPAGSAAEAAREADAVVTMLPDPATVVAVVLGDGAPADAAPPDTLLIDMSTSSPALATRIHERHPASVDAPVSGGVTGAREGTLTIMAGGDAEAIERARPVFAALGARVTHLGGPGAGQIAKAANQLVVALTIQAVAEALALARAAGVDPAAVREALTGGFADSRVLAEHGARMLQRDFEPGGALRLHLKDLRIALELAAEHGAALPATEQVAARVAELVEAGLGDRDHSALLLAYEREASNR